MNLHQCWRAGKLPSFIIHPFTFFHNARDHLDNIILLFPLILWATTPPDHFLKYRCSFSYLHVVLDCWFLLHSILLLSMLNFRPNLEFSKVILNFNPYRSEVPVSHLSAVIYRLYKCGFLPSTRSLTSITDPRNRQPNHSHSLPSTPLGIYSSSADF